MPTINYKELKKYIKENKEDQFASVFLIYGEELLCKEAFEKLLDALVGCVFPPEGITCFARSSEDM